MNMRKYENLSGDSGVTGYQIYESAVAVEFGDRTYLYSYQNAGTDNVERMKLLARRGRGLATFINQHVPPHFAKRIR